MKKTLVKIFVLLACVGLSQGAEIFTTTGSAGEKVYTDKPARNASKVNVQYQKAPVAESTQLESEDGRSLSAMTPCERARYVVSKYTDAELLAEKDDDGNTRILSATEARAMIERARADEVRLCEEQDDDA